jgi:hypothetical protein
VRFRFIANIKGSESAIGKVPHSPSPCRLCDSQPFNYALLFRGIRIQRSKVVLLLRLLDTEQTLVL